MSTRRKHIKKDTAFFVTFTCFKWLTLIEEADAYSSFYKWFHYLKTINVKLLGYVIMPNHFHCIVFITIDCTKTLNQIISNCKRFIAYSIINGLESKHREHLLQFLFVSASLREKNKGQKHKVFEESFDAKELMNKDMLIVKLDYVHRNPCQGKWFLAPTYTEYFHSSAAFYHLEQSNEWLTDYREIYI